MLEFRWMIKNSAKISLVVGTILVAINQWDVILRGSFTPLLILKILLTYAVPFCVSLYGSFSYARRKNRLFAD